MMAVDCRYLHAMFPIPDAQSEKLHLTAHAPYHNPAKSESRGSRRYLSPTAIQRLDPSTEVGTYGSGRGETAPLGAEKRDSRGAVPERQSTASFKTLTGRRDSAGFFFDPASTNLVLNPSIIFFYFFVDLGS